MSGEMGSSERGQILIVLAFSLFFVLLGATAVAIDLGNGHLQKRRLQSAADAAALAGALEKAKGGDAATAEARVRDVLMKAGITPPASVPYAGVGLVEGIDTQDSVRVALKRDVKTFFASVMGINTITVNARAHAKEDVAGVLPIAVKRWSAGDTRYPTTSPINSGYTIYDNLRPESAGPISGWPSPLSAPPSPPAGLAYPSDPNRPNVSGPVIPILGQKAFPNVAHTANFHFWVAPDVRNITDPAGALYSAGLDSSSSVNELKRTESAYFAQKGYSGDPILVGQQIGVLYGVDWGQTVDEMKKVFPPGSIVTAYVYDGTVYDKPSFNLDVTPLFNTQGSINLNTGGSAAGFAITLEPVNGFASPLDGVQFSAMGLKRPLDKDHLWLWDPADWARWTLYEPSLAAMADWNKARTYIITGGSSETIPFYILSDSSTQVQGARTAQIRAYDLGGKVVKMATATVVAGGSPWTQTYTVSCSDAYRVVKQGDTKVKFDIRFWSHNGYQRDPGVDILGYDWFRPSSDPANPEPVWAGPGSYGTPSPPFDVPNPQPGVVLYLPANMKVKVLSGNPPNKNFLNLELDIPTTAQTGEWLLRLAFSDGSPRYDDPTKQNIQYIYLALQINEPDAETSPANTSSFVYVLGYANFVVDHYDGNTVYGYAVSGLSSTPEGLPYGMKPRLVGWFQ